MKHTTMIIGTLLMISSLGCSQAPAPMETKPAEAKMSDPAKDVDDIKAMEERLGKAIVAKDVGTIMSFYVPDESLFVFDVIPPRQYVGATAYRKDWEDTLGLIPGPVEASVSNLEITAGGGDLAWGHSIQRLAGTMKSGKKLDLMVRVTDGYKRINGQWLIAHEHVSVPVDLMTGKADFASKP